MDSLFRSFGYSESDLDLGYAYPLLRAFSYRYYYGAPGVKQAAFKEANIFQAEVWALILVSVLAMAALLEGIRRVYLSLAQYQEGLVAANIGPGSLFLKVLSTLTEPESLKLYPLWSTGNFS